MDVKIIPCLKDNYAYVVKISNDDGSSQNVLIDAPEFTAIDEFLEKEGIKIDFILSTHHHHDHIGGNLELKRKYNCKIYGSQDDQARIPGIDHHLKHEEVFKIANCEIKSLFVPGHTNYHLIYYFKNENLLFCGDTLFSMGCGRLFEGTYMEMYNSLQKIKTLPDETMIYCGHEYSVRNAKFALEVEPNNQTLKDRYKKVLKLREENKPTVPTTLALEKEINPFLRASSVDEFTDMRQFRDTF